MPQFSQIERVDISDSFAANRFDRRPRPGLDWRGSGARTLQDDDADPSGEHHAARVIGDPVPTTQRRSAGCVPASL